MRAHISPRLDLDRRYAGISPRLKDAPAAPVASASPAEPQAAEAEPEAASHAAFVGPDGVPFASARAEELAIEAGISLERLRGEVWTGATGFTVADILRIAEG
jgi:pyruvate/2-oxoglutarate dehydrogenase complex dihydrolipoamide acyltransferase (E2) component